MLALFGELLSVQKRHYIKIAQLTCCALVILDQVMFSRSERFISYPNGTSNTRISVINNYKHNKKLQ